MIKIDVLSEDKRWSKKIKKKEVFFHSVCKAFPEKYKFVNKKIFLILLLSNNKEIKKLNNKFRKKNKATDILSFPVRRKVKIKKDSYLGDIIISHNFRDKPKKQSLKLFRDKVIRTFIHGFLHLLGFDHIKFKDYKKMLREEQRIYQSVVKKIY